MAGVHDHHAEAALLRIKRRIGEHLHDVVNLLLVHGIDGPFARNVHRAVTGLGRIAASSCIHAGMSELGRTDRTLAADRVGHPCQSVVLHFVIHTDVVHRA